MKKDDLFDISKLNTLLDHPVNTQINNSFRQVLKVKKQEPRSEIDVHEEETKPEISFEPVPETETETETEPVPKLEPESEPELKRSEEIKTEAQVTIENDVFAQQKTGENDHHEEEDHFKNDDSLQFELESFTEESSSEEASKDVIDGEEELIDHSASSINKEQKTNTSHDFLNESFEEFSLEQSQDHARSSDERVVEDEKSFSFGEIDLGEDIADIPESVNSPVDQEKSEPEFGNLELDSPIEFDHSMGEGSEKKLDSKDDSLQFSIESFDEVKEERAESVNDDDNVLNLADDTLETVEKNFDLETLTSLSDESDETNETNDDGKGTEDSSMDPPELGLDSIDDSFDFGVSKILEDAEPASPTERTEDKQKQNAEFLHSMNDFSVEEFSEDAKRKLEEIDEIMIQDASKNQLSSEEKESLRAAVPDRESSHSEISSKTDQTEKTEKEMIVSETEKAPLSELTKISRNYQEGIEEYALIISEMREERQKLLDRMQNLEEEHSVQSSQILGLKSELEERNIEMKIMRKKLHDEIQELRDENHFLIEYKMILEEKNAKLSKKLEQTYQKNQIHINSVKHREKELEQKLEFLKIDSEHQIQSRDKKILDMKRKIESLEFDMETMSFQEKRSLESKYQVEEKLNKAIKTLKFAISALENDEQSEDFVKMIKKNISMS